MNECICIWGLFQIALGTCNLEDFFQVTVPSYKYAFQLKIPSYWFKLQVRFSKLGIFPFQFDFPSWKLQVPSYGWNLPSSKLVRFNCNLEVLFFLQVTCNLEFLLGKWGHFFQVKFWPKSLFKNYLKIFKINLKFPKNKFW